MLSANPAIPQSARWADLWWSLWPALAGLLALLAFFKVGEAFYNNYMLDLGSTGRPTPGYMRFVELWALFGTAAAGFLGVGFGRLAAREGGRAGFGRAWDSFPAGWWMLIGSLAGLAIPVTLRLFLLHGAPLTDDESAYRFMAELLASGRLRASSPPLKLFFDRTFMINDGHLYAQYFIGWPALMVPGVWLGCVGMMNPVYSALTVPALFLVARRLAGSAWAKVAVLLYLASPMLMVGAATELAHTSCLMALAWMTWFFLCSQDELAPWWSHAGVAFCFGLAFLIRPTSAFPIALPVLVAWALGRCAQRGRRLVASVAGFLLPALLLAGVFLSVNNAQNGSFRISGYQRYRAYLKENGYRFSGWNEELVERSTPGLHRSLVEIPSQAWSVVVRLNFDLFGWPSSLLFIWFAGLRRQAWLHWLALLGFLALHLFLVPFDAGIDSFGPIHYFEMAWPILLLTVLGLRRLWQGTRARRPGRVFRRVPVAYLPPAWTAALVLVALAGYVPVRFGAIARIADNVNMPREAVSQAGLHKAVVFAPEPFAPNCRSTPTRHFVFFPPNNDPDLSNDVLWANDLGVEDDRQLMGYFPERRGYVLVWMRPCAVRLLPLDRLAAVPVPDVVMGRAERRATVSWSPARGTVAPRAIPTSCGLCASAPHRPRAWERST